MSCNNSLAMFDTLQAVANTGRPACITLSSDCKVENVRLGAITNAPQALGTPRPEEEETAERDIQDMETAEQKQIDKKAADDHLDGTFKPEDDQLHAELKELTAPLDKYVYDRNKARYQAAKGQYEMSGEDTKAKSHVEGFDGYDDDTKPLY